MRAEIATSHHTRGGFPVVASVSLHGDTPSLSWSPDGTRLLTQGGVYDELDEEPEYNDDECCWEDCGYYDEEYEDDECCWEECGYLEEVNRIYVLDTRTHQSVQIHEGWGLNPMWLDDDSVVWMDYGLMHADLGDVENPTYHDVCRYNDLIPGKDGKVLCWDDGEWIAYDPYTRTREVVADYDEEIPVDMVESQCIQKVGGVEVEIEDGHYVVSIQGRKYPLHDARLGYFENYGVEANACLSPDGKYLALMEADSEYGWEYTVTVIALPVADGLPES